MIRNRLAIFLVALASAVVLNGCTNALTSDINVDSQAAPGLEMTSYKTYTWLAAAQILNDPDGQWEPRGFDADAEIQFLIDRELRQHGATEVSANPDLFVAYIAGVDMEALELEDDPGSDLEMMKSSPQGALMILLIDANTGKAVWGAVATGEVEGRRSEEEARARLDYAVTQMLARLPTA